MKRVTVIAATGLVLAFAAAGAIAAGWWFLIREDAGLATSPPEIPEGLVDATATASSTEGSTNGSSTDSDVLTFRINSSLSEAAYFVDEELASVGIPSTAKGATSEISGTFYVTGEGAAFSPDAASSFTVDLRNLTSDKPMRDRRVQEALATSAYPTATFRVTSVTGYDPSIPEGGQQNLQLIGILDLHGVQEEVTWEVEAFRQGNVISALATLKISFADFNITPPTFAGLVSIDDRATLQVQLIAELA